MKTIFKLTIYKRKGKIQDILSFETRAALNLYLTEHKPAMYTIWASSC